MLEFPLPPLFSWRLLEPLIRTWSVRIYGVKIFRTMWQQLCSLFLWNNRVVFFIHGFVVLLNFRPWHKADGFVQAKHDR